MGLEYGSPRQAARITYTTEQNDRGESKPCVYAECLESENTVGPVWGDGEPSVRRALATLTSECDCGARYHYDDEE